MSRQQSRRNSVERQRKYAPPPPLGGMKDDLHEWSIYRQNLTSTIAESLLSGLANVQPFGAATGGSTRSSARGRTQYALAEGGNLPYGDFQMHDQAVESVLNHGRRQDPYLGDKGQVYLRFGLPRVALPNEKGVYALARPGGLDYKNRKSQSLMDVRRVVLEAPATRGPYFVKSSTSMDLLNLIGSRPLQQQSHEYAHSEIALHRPGDWRIDALALGKVSNRASTRSLHDHLRAPLSLALPGSVTIDGPSSSVSAPSKPILGTRTAPSPLTSGAFMKGNRHHHGHYFSNLDLFVASNAYNYLRYAKADELQTPVSKQPHLQLRRVGFEIDRRSKFDAAMLRAPKYRRILEDISLEVFGGEALAIMYTSKEEINTLLSFMADQHGLKGRMDGSILINGLPISGKLLGDRIAYVCSHELHPHLTVREHLRLQCAFIKPATEIFPTHSMIANLIQTLALAPFSEKLISDLGRTEHQRVKIACQVLLDADILLLDDIFRDMDLYDAAFVIDYLRDWASKLNRIVIAATNPWTFEILAMYNKAAVLSSGRLMYFGSTRKMMNYFESLNYPCPLFKNPCDYYVDLVTHDHITMEVAIESNERIRRLAEAWHKKAPPLTEPSPGGLVPARFRRANACTATFWIYYRFWLLFSNRPWQYGKEFAYSLLMSLILGAIFCQLTITKQTGINDRIGFFYALLTLCHIPNLLLNIQKIRDERRLTYTDNIHHAYTRIAYIVAKICFDLPLAVSAYAIYSTPVYFMAQLQSVSNDNGRIYGVYLGLTVLYCYATRMLAWASAYIFKSKFHAALFTGFILTIIGISSGVTLHPNDGHLIFHWIRYISPVQWIQQILVEHEFLGNATEIQISTRPGFRRSTTMLQFGCDTREIKFGLIVTTEPCPITNGLEAFRFANLTLNGVSSAQNATYYIGLSITAGSALLFFIISCFATSLFNCEPKRKLRHRDS